MFNLHRLTTGGDGGDGGHFTKNVFYEVCWYCGAEERWGGRFQKTESKKKLTQDWPRPRKTRSEYCYPTAITPTKTASKKCIQDDLYHVDATRALCFLPLWKKRQRQRARATAHMATPPCAGFRLARVWSRNRPREVYGSNPARFPTRLFSRLTPLEYTQQKAPPARKQKTSGAQSNPIHVEPKVEKAFSRLALRQSVPVLAWMRALSELSSVGI